MSHIGQQYLAPNGCGPLIRTRSYHFLGLCSSGTHVRFVWFTENPLAAHIEMMERKVFEAGLEEGSLKVAKTQKHLPPWHESIEKSGVSPGALEQIHVPSRRSKRKRSNEDEVNIRSGAVTKFLEQYPNALRNDDLDQALNKYARNAKPILNEARFRLWFYTYVAFGKNKWTLLPNRSRCGRKKIEEAGPGDFGRDSPLRGRLARTKMTAEMRDQICEGYRKYSALGKKYKELVSTIICKVFGARTRRVGKARMEFYHPSGSPIPTQCQVDYVLLKKIGRKQIQIDLYGRERIRNRKSASKGSYTEYIANLLEKVEADAYFLSERPANPYDGSPMPPMIVVRLRCSGSGALVGIGFSIGGERAEAYRMALFSMAMDKQAFCKLFGMNIDPDQWPCKGMSPWLVYDRGPGGRDDSRTLAEIGGVIRTIVPAYSGQSKAVVESSHPRKTRLEGAPTYRLSKLTYVELAKREIARLIADNTRIDRSRSLTLTMLRERVFPTPLGIWNYYDSRCRTSAYPMALHDAVESFLPSIEFSIDGEGAHLEGALFRSAELERTGICELAAIRGVQKVVGYAPSVCLRGAWLRVRGQLIWVDMCQPLSDDESQLYISLPELEEIDRIRRENRAIMAENSEASRQFGRQLFEESSGKDWDTGVTKRGRSARKKQSNSEDYRLVKRALRA